MISEICVAASLLGTILVYCWFSKKTKTWINVLTPHLILTIPTNFLSELYNLHINSPSDNGLYYFIIYFTYFFTNLCFAFGYAFIKLPNRTFSFNTKARYGATTIAAVGLGALLLYLPVMLEFQDSLLNPREIYTQTRTGYGLNYFLSSTLGFIFLALVLFKENYPGSLKALALILTIFFCYIHGSKGQIINAIFICMLWYFVIREQQVRIAKFALVTTSFGAIGATVFYSMLVDVNTNELAAVMAGYADYSRNAVMLVSSDLGSTSGKIFLEDNFYSRIPRILFPEKPKDFGSYGLALKYFPNSFYEDQGVPSFGIGVHFSDFHVFAILLLGIGGALSGWLTKIFVRRCIYFRSPIDFIVVLFSCGIVLIPLGVGYLLPEHILLALLVFYICKIKLRTR